MQTLSSISKRYAINEHNEAYYTVELTDLMTGATDAAFQFGSLNDIVDMMDCSIFSAFGDDADPAQYRAVISHGKIELVVMPTCAGPDDAIITAPARPERYEVREIDAWHDGEGWTYNTTYRLGTFATYGDPARALRRYLKTRHGITFYKGRTVTEYDGDVYEICDRATRQPLYAAIPQEV